MQSPAANTLEPPRTAERRRRGRAVDVMGFPTPDHTSLQQQHHHHLPTPVTQRKKTTSGTGAASASHTHLPTPQTLPRNRTRSLRDIDDDDHDPDHRLDNNDHDNDDPFSTSPSGHTTFFLSHAAATAAETQPQQPRRRPGLLFAQQMGFAAGPSSNQPLKFGARLGVGVGMGGGLRSTLHGAAGPSDGSVLFDTDDDNPFVDNPAPTAKTSKVGFSLPPAVRVAPPPDSPGADTRYIPQAVRLSAERSLSPLSAGRFKGRARMLFPVSSGAAAESSTAAQRRRAMMDEDDNPFMSKPGEVVRARPTNEDHPVVTYVFRGAKKVFANPFINPAVPHPGANLDMADPDYDAHPCPPPRLLWPSRSPAPVDEPTSSPTPDEPQTPKASTRRVLSAHRSLDMDIDAGALTDDDPFLPEHDDDDDDDDDDLGVDELDATPKPRRGLLFGGAGASKPTSSVAAAAPNTTLGKRRFEDESSSSKRARVDEW